MAIVGYLVMIFLACCTAATDWVQGAEPFSIDLRRNIHPGDGALNGVAFSPDSTVIAAGGTRFAHVLDAKTGERLHRLEGHTATVTSIAFSPDGKLLASASMDKTIRLWEVRSGNQIKVLQGGKFPVEDVPRTGVAFFPDGKMLASCGADENVILWDIETGLGEYRARTNGTKSVYLALTPDGKRCAVAGGPNRYHLDDFAGQISAYKLRYGLQPLWRGKHEGDEAATHVAFSPDGTKLVSSGGDNTVRVWAADTGRLLTTLNGPIGSRAIQSAVFSPDGAHILSVTQDETIQHWNATEGNLLATTKGSDPGVRGAALSPDGKTFITCGEDKLIKLWDLR